MSACHDDYDGDSQGSEDEADYSTFQSRTEDYGQSASSHNVDHQIDAVVGANLPDQLSSRGRLSSRYHDMNPNQSQIMQSPPYPSSRGSSAINLRRTEPAIEMDQGIQVDPLRLTQGSARNFHEPVSAIGILSGNRRPSGSASRIGSASQSSSNSLLSQPQVPNAPIARTTPASKVPSLALSAIPQKKPVPQAIRQQQFDLGSSSNSTASTAAIGAGFSASDLAKLQSQVKRTANVSSTTSTGKLPSASAPSKTPSIGQNRYTPTLNGANSISLTGSAKSSNSVSSSASNALGKRFGNKSHQTPDIGPPPSNEDFPMMDDDDDGGGVLRPDIFLVGQPIRARGTSTQAATASTSLNVPSSSAHQSSSSQTSTAIAATVHKSGSRVPNAGRNITAAQASKSRLGLSSNTTQLSSNSTAVKSSDSMIRSHGLNSSKSAETHPADVQEVPMSATRELQYSQLYDSLDPSDGKEATNDECGDDLDEEVFASHNDIQAHHDDNYDESSFIEASQIQKASGRMNSSRNFQSDIVLIHQNINFSGEDSVAEDEMLARQPAFMSPASKQKLQAKSRLLASGGLNDVIVDETQQQQASSSIERNLPTKFQQQHPVQLASPPPQILKKPVQISIPDNQIVPTKNDSKQQITVPVPPVEPKLTSATSPKNASIASNALKSSLLKLSESSQAIISAATASTNVMPSARQQLPAQQKQPQQPRKQQEQSSSTSASATNVDSKVTVVSTSLPAAPSVTPAQVDPKPFDSTHVSTAPVISSSKLSPASTASNLSTSSNDLSSTAIPNPTRDLVHKALEALYLEVPPVAQQSAFATLKGILSNLMIRPAKDIYRSLRLKNPKFYDRLGKYGTARRVLQTIGFQETKLEDASTIPVATIAVEPDYQATLSYGGPSNSATPSISITSAISTPSIDAKIATWKIEHPAPATAVPSSNELNDNSKQIERRLTASEKREAEERIYLLMPEEIERNDWFVSLLQHTIDRIDSVILKRVQQSQQALAEMDAETRYQEEVKEARNAFNELIADAALNPSDLSIALQSLRQIMTNVAVQPPQAKFRKLQQSNPAFNQRIGRWKSAIKFLQALGFREAGGNLFLLPAFEKPPHQMTRISTWLDQKIPEADKAAKVFLKQKEDEAKVAEFHARQAAKGQPSNQIGAPEDQFHGVIDREVQVFPAALLVTMNKLEAKDDNDAEDNDGNKYSAGDLQLILSAQKSYAKTLEKQRQREIQRMAERNNIDLSKMPSFTMASESNQDEEKAGMSISSAGSAAALALLAGGKGGNMAAALKAAAKATKADNQQKQQAAIATATEEEDFSAKLAESQVTIRFVFPEGVAVQALFHPKESLDVVFDFVRSQLLNDSTINFFFRLPPVQLIHDPRSSESSSDKIPTLQQVGLIYAVNLYVKLSDSNTTSVSGNDTFAAAASRFHDMPSSDESKSSVLAPVILEKMLKPDLD